MRIKVSKSHFISLQLGTLAKGSRSCIGTLVLVECTVTVTGDTALLGEANSHMNMEKGISPQGGSQLVQKHAAKPSACVFQGKSERP